MKFMEMHSQRSSSVQNCERLLWWSDEMCCRTLCAIRMWRRQHHITQSMTMTSYFPWPQPFIAIVTAPQTLIDYIRVDSQRWRYFIVTGVRQRSSPRKSTLTEGKVWFAGNRSSDFSRRWRKRCSTVLKMAVQTRPTSYASQMTTAEMFPMQPTEFQSPWTECSSKQKNVVQLLSFDGGLYV